MKTLSIAPEQLLTILLGQPVTLRLDYTGLLLLAAEKNKQRNLPSEMAACIIYIDNRQITFVSLVHPFKVHSHFDMCQTDDNHIHREPYNWFGPQSLVIEKKLKDFSMSYDGPLNSDGNIPREFIPDNIAEPVRLSDKYWQDYTQFVNDPDHSFAAQIKPMFKQQ